MEAGIPLTVSLLLKLQLPVGVPLKTWKDLQYFWQAMPATL
jgi:hypothetical protein